MCVLLRAILQPLDVTGWNFEQTMDFTAYLAVSNKYFVVVAIF